MATDAELKQFRADVITAHNNYRARHSAPALTSSDDLHSGAQSWADNVADTGFLQYSEKTDIGESILFVEVNGHKPCGQQVMGEWYRESSVYLFNLPRWRKDTMHFTQMVWKSTTEMGVGVAKVRGQDRWVIVTQYRPPGNTNMPGDFSNNVLPSV